MKRYYIINDENKLTILPLTDETEIGIFETEYADKILCQGDTLQELVEKFSTLLNLMTNVQTGDCKNIGHKDGANKVF